MEKDYMIEVFKKPIYKTGKIWDIFARSKRFYELWKKSKYFSFPQALEYTKSHINYEKIQIWEYITGYQKVLNTWEINLLAQALWDLYRALANEEVIHTSEKQDIHGDLHLGNVLFPKNKDKKLLFLDPETPNSFDYELFSYNSVVFEIAYMYYHLDNHWPVWNKRFYRNNRTFKGVFFESFSELLLLWSKKTWKDEIFKEYKKHIKRKCIISYNPLIFIHRVVRQVLIYIKFYLWKNFEKYSGE